MTSESMLARRRLRLAALDALAGAGLGMAIDSPSGDVLAGEVFPAISLQATRVSKTPFLRSSVEFTSTVTLEVNTRVQAFTAAAAQEAIEMLDWQVERALLTNDGLIALTQKMSVLSDTTVQANADAFLANTRMTLDCELIEVIDPIDDAPASLQPVAVDLAGLDVHMDLAGTFDATGDYQDSNPAFPDAVVAAPRLSGPDGRDEGGLTIDF